MTLGHPRVLGRAGGGLDNAQWAVNADVARIGKSGETRTAEMLNRCAQPDTGPTVLHDLAIPIPGFTANIDHVVVTGREVHIIDSKVWKPARYWTAFGQTRRGMERFEPAEKKTMEMAFDAISRYLADKSVTATVREPVLVIWPSSTRKPLKVRMLKVPGARALDGTGFERYVDKHFTGSRLLGIGANKNADPAVVHALAALLPNQRRRPTGTGGW